MFGRKQPAVQRLEPAVAPLGSPPRESGGFTSSGLSPASLWLEHRQLALAVGLDWRLCAKKTDQRSSRQLWKSRGMAGRFEVALPAGALLMAPCPPRYPGQGPGYSAAALLGIHLTQAIVVANLGALGAPGAGFWVCRVSGGRPVSGCDLLLPDQAAALDLVSAWLDDSLQAVSVYGDIPGSAMSAADLLSEIDTAVRSGLYNSKDLGQARLLRLEHAPGRFKVWLALLMVGGLGAALAYGWWSVQDAPAEAPLAALATPSPTEADAERQRLEQERLARVRAELQQRFDADVQAARQRLQARLQEAWRVALETASATPLHRQGAQVQGVRCTQAGQGWRCTYDWRSPQALSRTRLLDRGVQVGGAEGSLQQFNTQRELPPLPSRPVQALWPVGLSDAHLPLWLADLFQGLHFEGARLSPPTDEVLTPASYQKDGVTLEGDPVTVARYHPLDLSVPLHRADMLYLLASLPMLVDEFELRDGSWNIKARLVGPVTLMP
jgi:hypothetical protein